MKLHPEIAQLLDQETEGIAEIRNAFGVDLSCDHGITAISESALAEISDVEQAVDHDPKKLIRMARAVSA